MPAFRASLLSVLIAFIVLLTNCTNTPASKPTANEPIVAEVTSPPRQAWGSDGYLYEETALPSLTNKGERWWRKTATYRTFPTPGNDLVFITHEADGRVIGVDLRTHGWLYTHDYGAGLDYKSSDSEPNIVYVSYQGRWLTLPEYQVALNNVRNQEAEAGRQRYAHAQQMMTDAYAHMVRTWTAPACNSSYNGCR